MKGESLDGGCIAFLLGVADEDGKDADSEELICSSEEGVLNDGTILYMAVKWKDTSHTKARNDILWSDGLVPYF